MTQISLYRKKINTAIRKAKKLVSQNKIDEGKEFDIRSELYALAMQMCPHARDDDIATMKEWVNPQPGKPCIDLAAGTGFLTKHLAEWTGATVYAVDYSFKQLRSLASDLPKQIIPIVNSLAQESDSPRKIGILEQIPEPVDIITSFGGIHHIYYQEKMIEHAEKLLKPGGRFVAADVGGHTPLASYFDNIVAQKCLTGHSARWLSEERLQELINPHNLTLTRCEYRTQHWIFASKEEMALFFKGLHAYDLEDEEIIDDLYEALGFEEKADKIRLNWPMLFFNIQKV